MGAVHYALLMWPTHVIRPDLLQHRPAGCNTNEMCQHIIRPDLPLDVYAAGDQLARVHCQWRPDKQQQGRGRSLQCKGVQGWPGPHYVRLRQPERSISHELEYGVTISGCCLCGVAAQDGKKGVSTFPAAGVA